jgi:hypothetical protein
MMMSRIMNHGLFRKMKKSSGHRDKKASKNDKRHKPLVTRNPPGVIRPAGCRRDNTERKMLNERTKQNNQERLFQNFRLKGSRLKMHVPQPLARFTAARRETARAGTKPAGLCKRLGIKRLSRNSGFWKSCPGFSKPMGRFIFLFWVHPGPPCWDRAISPSGAVLQGNDYTTPLRGWRIRSNSLVFPRTKNPVDFWLSIPCAAGQELLWQTLPPLKNP